MKHESSYIRQYVQSAAARPERRRFQVGDQVHFHFPYNKTWSPGRAATVISHDTYYVEGLPPSGYMKRDAFYTILFHGTGTTRSWIRAAWLIDLNEYKYKQWIARELAGTFTTNQLNSLSPTLRNEIMRLADLAYIENHPD